MKAAKISQYGSVEINHDFTKPSPKDGQLLVEVKAASLNPFDAKILSGIYKETIRMQFPFTPGGDYSGVVAGLGENVSGLSIGDEVFGSAMVLNGSSGAFAQFASANAASSSLKPKNTDFIEAASLPLVGVSAIQAIEELIKLKRGQKILIHGGAGGIGSIAIQLAKSIGAYVATTVSPDDKEFAKSLGADQVIDYKSEKFEELVFGFDVVFDTVGGEAIDKSFKVLQIGGVLVSMLGQPAKELAQQYGVEAIGQNTEINQERLKRLVQLTEQGVIKPQVDKTFPLEQTKEAFEYLEKDSPRGKVVINFAYTSPA